MNILISYEKKEMPVALASGDTVALYEVPEEYSEDRLYLSSWGGQNLEPVPACDNARLLLKLRLEPMGDCSCLQEIYSTDGVEYAQN